MIASHLLLAQSESAGGGNILFTVVLFGAVIYFLMIRPQRTRLRKQQELARNIEVGDQVRTVGGMFGVVVGIQQDSVILGIEEGRIRVAMGAIAGRIEPEVADEPESDDFGPA